jgi:hypothetical protein
VLVGAVAATPTHPVLATLGDAAARLREGDAAGAETLARAVLAQYPEQPEGLRILGRCAYDQGRPLDGLALVLRAARSMQMLRVDPATQFMVWSDVGFMFGVALSGVDSRLAAIRRSAYSIRTPSASADLANATVSIIVVASDDNADGANAAFSRTTDGRDASNL